MPYTERQLKQFTSEIMEEFAAARIHAPVHFCGGNESDLIEIFKTIDPSDYVFSTWRSHYHALLHGVPRDVLRQEILNGHSINLNFPQYRFFTSGIVGGILPIACGVAAAGQRTWCFIGDMTASIGAFYDAWHYASGHDLPVTFVVEDNGLATNTPTESTWGTKAGGSQCRVIRYAYQRAHPHVGLTQFVQF